MKRDERVVCALLNRTLALARADVMVLGHTVQPAGVPRTRCGGRIVLADVGFGEYYGGNHLALEHSVEDEGFRVVRAEA